MGGEISETIDALLGRALETLEQRLCSVHYAYVSGLKAKSDSEFVRLLASPGIKTLKPDKIDLVKRIDLKARCFTSATGGHFKVQVSGGLACISTLLIRSFLLSGQGKIGSACTKGIFKKRYLGEAERHMIGATILGCLSSAGDIMDDDEKNQPILKLMFATALSDAISRQSSAATEVFGVSSSIAAMFVIFHEYWHIYGDHFEIREELLDLDVDEADLLASYRAMEYLADGAAMVTMLGFAVELTETIRKSLGLGLNDALKESGELIALAVGAVILLEDLRENWMRSAFSGTSHPHPSVRFAAIVECMHRLKGRSPGSLIEHIYDGYIAGFTKARALLVALLTDEVADFRPEIDQAKAHSMACSDIGVLYDLFEDGDWPTTGHFSQFAHPEASMFKV